MLCYAPNWWCQDIVPEDKGKQLSARATQCFATQRLCVVRPWGVSRCLHWHPQSALLSNMCNLLKLAQQMESGKAKDASRWTSRCFWKGKGVQNTPVCNLPLQAMPKAIRSLSAWHMAGVSCDTSQHSLPWGKHVRKLPGCYLPLPRDVDGRQCGSSWGSDRGASTGWGIRWHGSQTSGRCSWRGIHGLHMVHWR